MTYNKYSIYEKPISEIPAKCGECDYFRNNFCWANNCRTFTFDFNNPNDRPLPYNLNCFWWYANSLLTRLPATKQLEIVKERQHFLTFYTLLNCKTLSPKKSESLIAHYFRNSGGGIIDFEDFPEAKKVFDIIKTNESCYKQKGDNN